jgi:RNA polymerase sigma-70 factor (ECF subfamily)
LGAIGATAGGVNDEGLSAASGAAEEATPASEGEDAALVRAAREGDRAAFGRLYERHARMVHGILLARAPRAEVDDLVHEVFLQAMRRLASLREVSAFAPWLAAITRNRARDHFRRAGDEIELKDDVAGAPHPEGEAMAVLAAIRRLPEAYRETLVLRLVEGLTGPEIAERTGLQPGSVRVNLHRGMQMLRAALGGGGRENP